MTVTAEAVERGRQAYESVRHDDNDPVTGIYDLITDLLHYADTLDATVHGFTDPGEDSVGAFCLRMAERHYEAETEPFTVGEDKDGWFASQQVFAGDVVRFDSRAEAEAWIAEGARL